MEPRADVAARAGPRAVAAHIEEPAEIVGTVSPPVGQIWTIATIKVETITIISA